MSRPWWITRNRAAAAVPVVPPTAAASEYKIEKGDNYTTIAKKFGVTVKALQAANPNDPTKLQIGKPIQIPAATAR